MNLEDVQRVCHDQEHKADRHKDRLDEFPSGFHVATLPLAVK